MVAQMSALTLAGHETTANTVTWVLYELARHPDHQAKLRGEIARKRREKPAEAARLVRELLGEAARVDDDEGAEYSDIQLDDGDEQDERGEREEEENRLLVGNYTDDPEEGGSSGLPRYTDDVDTMKPLPAKPLPDKPLPEVPLIDA